MERRVNLNFSLMKKNLVLIILLVSVSTYNAQTFYKKRFDKYNGLKLPIKFILPTEDSELKEQFKKLVKKYWTISDDIDFLSPNSPVVGKKHISAVFYAIQYKRTPRIGQSMADVKMPGPYGDKANVFSMQIDGKVVLKLKLEETIGDRDIVYILKTAQYIIQNKNQWNKTYMANESVKLNGKELKEKTLLVPISYLGKLTEEEIKTNYPYKYEIVTEQVIQEKVMSESDEYLVINFGEHLWSDGKTTPHKIVFSPKTGAIVSTSVGKVSIAHVKYGNQLKPKDFKRFAQSIE